METTVNDLYNTRNKLLAKIQHDAGVDAKLVEKTVLAPGEDPFSAVMTVHLRDEELAPEASESS